MTRRQRQDEEEFRAFTVDGDLEKRVRDWSKYSDFRHLAGGSPCSICGKSKYYFTPEDAEGFCTNCFNQRWIVPKHKRGWHGLGANSSKKQKGKNVIEGSKEEDKE